MKKTILCYLLLAIVYTAQAQTASTSQPKNILFSAETQFDVFSRNSSIVPNLKLRLHFGEKSALRTTWLIDYGTIVTEIHEADGDGVGSVEKKNMLNTFSLGYEKHFKSGRISPYIGGELIGGFGSQEEYGARTDSSNFVSDFNYSSKVAINQLGVQVFTGIDVELFKGLYVGTEIGYRFLSTAHKRGEFSTNDASSTTASTTQTSIPSATEKTFSLANLGVVRIGWLF